MQIPTRPLIQGLSSIHLSSICFGFRLLITRCIIIHLVNENHITLESGFGCFPNLDPFYLFSVRWFWKPSHYSTFFPKCDQYLFECIPQRGMFNLFNKSYHFHSAYQDYSSKRLQMSAELRTCSKFCIIKCRNVISTHNC